MSMNSLQIHGIHDLFDKAMGLILLSALDSPIPTVLLYIHIRLISPLASECTE